MEGFVYRKVYHNTELMKQVFYICSGEESIISFIINTS